MRRGSARTRRTAAAALLLGVSVLASRPAAAQHSQTAPLRGLDGYIRTAMRNWRVPGLAIAIVHGDSVVYERGFGVRRLGRPGAVDPHTLFAIGSDTKAFTAALMAMLVDSGRVRWDSPVTVYLPRFALRDPYASREMTVRDLLTHRSGLPRGDRVWYATTLSRRQIVARLRWLRPAWSFRSHFGYQNIMYLAAGELEARVAGERWDDLVEQRILGPLGMTETLTTVRGIRGAGDVAAPHVIIDDTVRPVHWRNIDDIGPAGSLNSNVVDMAKWLRFQLDDGQLGGERLISARSMAEMRAPQMIVPVSARMRKLNPHTHFSAYGFGWFLNDYRGVKVIHHGGNIDGFSASVNLVPELRLGIVILTNLGSTALTEALPLHIYDLYLGGSAPDWSAAYLKLRHAREARADSLRDVRRRRRVIGTTPSLPLKRYAGTYADSVFGDVVVDLEDGHLVVRRPHAPDFVGDLHHWDYDNFRVVWRDPVLGRTFATFELDERGRPVVLRLHDWADFHRRPERRTP